MTCFRYPARGGLFAIPCGLILLTACSGSTPSEEKVVSQATPPRRAPNSPPGEAELQAAKTAASEGKLSAAIALSRSAIEANPRLEQAYLLLGSSCSIEGNDVCEQAAYQDGLDALPASALLQREMAFFQLRKGQIQEGVRGLEKARSMSNPVKADLLADLAIAYKMAGNIEGANKTIAESIKLDPNCLPCYMAQGEIAASQKDYAAAQEAYQSAIDKAPDSVEARRSLAKTVYLSGDVDRAATLYLRLAESADQDVRVQVQAGQVLMAAKRPGEAVARFEAAQKLVPPNPKLYEMLAKAYDAAGDKTKATAVRAEAKALMTK